MGQSFDERLPTMADDELYAVDRQTLNKRSQINLAREIAKRAQEKKESERRAAENAPRPEPPGVRDRWRTGQGVCVVTTLLAAALVAVLTAILR